MKIKFFKQFHEDNRQTVDEPLVIDFSKVYPKVTLSEELKRQAYHLFFLVETVQFNSLSNLLIKQYPTLNVNLFRSPQDLSDHRGNIFKINLLDDFNGIVVHLIANEHDFIEMRAS